MRFLEEEVEGLERAPRWVYEGWVKRVCDLERLEVRDEALVIGGPVCVEGPPAGGGEGSMSSLSLSLSEAIGSR